MIRELRRKVGACFVAGFDGTEVSVELLIFLRDYALGGVVLFSRNLRGPEQTAALISSLQGQTRELPLLVAVDQEGGRVSRLPSPPFTHFPSMACLGGMGSVESSRGLGRALAAELRSVGINWDFAPVLDVHTNPMNSVIGDRSLSPNPAVVARLGAAIIDGMQAGGVIATGKHFPGHGATSEDSHHVLPLVEKGREELEAVELAPFRTAIATGVATIMTAHVLYPALDPDRPATLSRKILSGLLRRELGFEGLVVSDDLEMKALHGKGTPGELAREALEAGVDVLLVCRSHEVLAEAWEGVFRAAEKSSLVRERVEEAWQRAMGLRGRFLLPYSAPDPDVARRVAGCEDHLRLAEEIARSAL